MPEFTAAQVAEHKTAKDCWITVNGRVFDVTKFLGYVRATLRGRSL